MASPRPQKIVHTIYTPFTPDFCNKIGHIQTSGKTKTPALGRGFVGRELRAQARHPVLTPLPRSNDFNRSVAAGQQSFKNRINLLEFRGFHASRP
jgi:hypothetical protein